MSEKPESLLHYFFRLVVNLPADAPPAQRADVLIRIPVGKTPSPTCEQTLAVLYYQVLDELTLGALVRTLLVI
jgi:hypothetical protein